VVVNAAPMGLGVSPSPDQAVVAPMPASVVRAKVEPKMPIALGVSPVEDHPVVGGFTVDVSIPIGFGVSPAPDVPVTEATVVPVPVVLWVVPDSVGTNTVATAGA